MAIRILLVDDHAVVRSGLRMLLGTESDVEIIGEAGTAAEALASTADLKPDVILMDIGLPDKSGIEATRDIKAEFPKVAIVALTIHEDEEYFFKMLEAGASGYVPKRAAPEELLTAIRAAAHGEVYLYPSMAKLLVRDFLVSEPIDKKYSVGKELTDREQEVLTHLAEGESNDEIAKALVISPKTVARHRENIMHKLNLHSRAELVRYAIRKGIIKA
ncbi:MAG: response regulator [Anaerolineales bacterium]